VIAADQPRHSDYLGARYFPSLDGLRFLSIAPVIWHHSTPKPPAGLLGRGPLGVDLFFCISGFLITTLLLRERAAAGRISLSQFYARRTLRIFPLYYAVLGLHVAYAWLLPPTLPERAHFFRSVPWLLTYTSNWLVDYAVAYPVIFAFAWSLATEEQFYLWWPWVLRLTKRAKWPALFMAALFTIDQTCEAGLLAGYLGPAGIGRRMLTSIATPICLGALLAIALSDRRTFAPLGRLLGARASAPMALATLAVLVAWPRAPLVLIHLAMAALVGACSIRPDHGLCRVTDPKPIRHVGTVSYGMYLFHVAVIGSVKAVLPADWRPAWLVFFVAFPATVAVASLSFSYFERPFLRLRDRFRAA
jgi:peptidoglycan/LPS O-acetylase OafA/YrhL